MPIYPDEEYTFGRDRSCSVVIADATVSRHHGLLSCRSDGSWVFRDNGSSNGSFLADRLDFEPVNGEREEVTRVSSGRSCRVTAGQSMVLGNVASPRGYSSP